MMMTKKGMESIYEEAVELRMAKAKSKESDAELLEVLSRDPYWDVRWYVACNPNANKKTLERLLKDPDFRIRNEVLRNLSYRKLLEDPVYAKKMAISNGLDALERGEFESGFAMLEKGLGSNEVEQVRYGVANGLTMEQVRLYAKEDFNWAQMAQVRTGFEEGLRFSAVETYASPSLSSSEMYQRKMNLIRNGIELEQLIQKAENISASKETKKEMKDEKKQVYEVNEEVLQ